MTFDILTIEAIVAAVSVSASVYLFCTNRNLKSKEDIRFLEKDLELSNKSLKDKEREIKRLFDQNNLLIKQMESYSIRDKEKKEFFGQKKVLEAQNYSLRREVSKLEKEIASKCCRCNDVVKKVTTSIHYSGDDNE
tara:strand:+ start:180 stop:587 length:408 start_codon:yes stop_codon:yes gene_type:complete